MCVNGPGLSDSVTVSIAFGGSQLILAAATLYHEDYVPTAWQTLLVYWASLLGSMLINLFFAAWVCILQSCRTAIDYSGISISSIRFVSTGPVVP
jgi:hypothetical protein